MKLRFLLFLMVSIFLASCGSARKKVVNKKNPGVVIVEPKPSTLPSAKEDKILSALKRENPNLNTTTLAYIKRFAPIAVQEMHEYKIPASITLAQGILESGSGRSNLALRSNNHFGIKCHVGWQGERVYHDDDEAGECFRKYIYPETSYNDRSLFLSERKRYAFLFNYNIKNYKKWANGLKAGYATDRKYPQKLIKIIEDYNLYEFDRISEKNYTNRNNDLTDKNETEKPVFIDTVSNKYYSIEKGDTLYSISRKFNISVERLKEINNLTDNIISIGQQLVVR